MIDSHYYPANWGVRPILFQIGNFDVPAYSFFVLLGLVVGAAVYFYESRKAKSLSENGFLIAVGALFGGVVGAKLLEWVISYKFVLSHWSDPGILFSGRTIVGGLIGGTLGAIITKRILKIKERRGNLFAPAIALGVAIGRLGCFFRGCCYGKETALPWGVDFGDGVSRHPTQLYESLFMLAMFVYLEIAKKKNPPPGQLFKILMIAYFIFRFFVEFIRFGQPAVFGLSVFQIISLGVIIYLIRGNIKNLILKLKFYGKQQ